MESSKSDVPEQTRRKKLLFAFLAILFSIWLLLLPKQLQSSSETALKGSYSHSQSQLLTIQGNTLVARNVLLQNSSENQSILATIYGVPIESETFLRIIECESSFRPDVCNKEFGCGAGAGLVQLIPKTIKYCEEKLGKKIDPFNPRDNLECGLWLYENESTRHWGYEGASWGSWNCWGRVDK